MSKLKVRNLFKGKFGRAKSTTDLSEWSKSDEKLMKAVEHGDTKKVAVLLSKKTLLPTKLGPLGRSVFHIACAHGNDAIVELLLKHTEDINDTTIQGNTPLQLAAAKGHAVTVQALLRANADVNQCDSNDMASLHHACAGLHSQCVVALLAGNANPHAKEKGGKTPLFYSAHRGSVDICRILIDKGANVNSQDNLNVTPLMIAAKEGHEHVCEFLLRRGARPSMVDREGHTALNYATAAGYPELVGVLTSVQGFHVHSAPASPTLTESNSRMDHSIAGSTDQLEATAAVPLTSNFSDNESHADDHSIHSMDDSLLAKCRKSSASPQSAARAMTEKPMMKSPGDGHSIHSMDDSLLDKGRRSPQSQQSPQSLRSDGPVTSMNADIANLPPAWAKTEKDLKELKEEHEQLNDEYSTLSIENLRLRDKLQAMQTKMTDGQQQEGDKPVPDHIQEEIRSLKSKLEQEQEKVKSLLVQSSEKEINSSSQGTEEAWPDSDEEDSAGKRKSEGGSANLNDTQLVAMLRSQIISLRQENDQLKSSVNLPNGGTAISKGEPSEDINVKDSDIEQKLKAMQEEKEQLQQEVKDLRSSSESSQLGNAVEQERLAQVNSELDQQVTALSQQLTLLEAELERVKSEMPSEAQRLDALLEQSRNFEEATYDDDGFVTGMDMTKEEFLQSQNQQLRAHCTLLSEELEKLRATFDAILKAGDNLQADYDQQALEKESLQDDLEAALKEKAEVMNENEFLLTDNNALHEDLKKLVHELEKMQEKLQKAQGENEELRQSAAEASSVGDVSHLLETRDVLQAKCDDYEITITRLQHDHGILVEEVESLTERVGHLRVERDQMATDLEMMDTVCQQLDTSQHEYNQLETDFNILLKEKEDLEASQSGTGDSGPMSTQELEASVKRLGQEREEAQTALHSLMEERDTLTNRVESLESELATMQNHNNNNSNNDTDNQINIEDHTEGLKHSSEDVISLKKQIGKLKAEILDWERKHADTVSTYRTHLLSAVQGHMDPDVKDALYHIIELRSMEQFC